MTRLLFLSGADNSCASTDRPAAAFAVPRHTHPSRATCVDTERGISASRTPTTIGEWL